MPGEELFELSLEDPSVPHNPRSSIGTVDSYDRSGAVVRLNESIAIGTEMFLDDRLPARITELRVTGERELLAQCLFDRQIIGDLRTKIVTSEFEPASVDLGPGLLGTIVDPFGDPISDSPLEKFFITSARSTGSNRSWDLTILKDLSLGTKIRPNEIYGQVIEQGLPHRLLYHSHFRGENLTRIVSSGRYTIDEPLFRTAEAQEVRLFHRSPIEPQDPRFRGTDDRTFQIDDQLFARSPPIRFGSHLILDEQSNTQRTIEALLLSPCFDLVITVLLDDQDQKLTELIPILLLKRSDGYRCCDRMIIVQHRSEHTAAAADRTLAAGLTYAQYYGAQGHRVLLFIDSFDEWIQTCAQTFTNVRKTMTEQMFARIVLERYQTHLARSGLQRIKEHTDEPDVGSITIVSYLRLIETNSVLTGSILDQVFQMGIRLGSVPHPSTERSRKETAHPDQDSVGPLRRIDPDA